MLRAILWKNLLLKRANFFGTLGEILLPVVFMSLLILIKNITSKYDSPNVAYYCGQTYPWFYNESGDLNNPDYFNTAPFSCTQKPTECVTNHYYQDNFFEGGYAQYGYVKSALSDLISNDPLYAYQIADSAPLYNQFYINNPSMPVDLILTRMQGNSVLLAVAPDVADPVLQTYAQDLVTYILDQTSHSFADTISLFPDQNTLDSYMTSSSYDNTDYSSGTHVGKVGMAIVVYEADVVAGAFDYSIRLNFTEYNTGTPTVACLYGSNPGTNESSYWGGPCQETYSIPTTKWYTSDLFKPQTTDFLNGYAYSGYAALQKMVDGYIFSLYDGTNTTIMSSVSMMPTATYETDNFQYVISAVLGIFYMLSFLYPVSRTVRALVVEKETRVKEGMKMMGLTDTIYNLSWFITTTTQMTLVSVLITLVTGSTVFEYSNKFLVFLYFEVFSLAAMNMCYLMATFFSRSKSASLLGPMIFFASFFPYYSVSDPQFATGTKTATCLLAPACFALGANVYADFEGGMVGVQAANANSLTSNFSYGLCIGMMFFDAVLYGVLAWYLDKVMPSEFGTPLPLWFPFLPSYWCGPDFCMPADARAVESRTVNSPLLSKRMLQDDDLAEDDDIETRHGTHGDTDKDFRAEPVPADLLKQRADGRCVRIRGLRKVFAAQGGSERVAVSNLHMDMYEGQVTVLLGHNGAGKSTTINMLVGLTIPTAGDAYMTGNRSISREMHEIRKHLGVCPQHDILFAELTVMQHLKMFASFKGLPNKEITEEAERMLREVGLVEKANAKASTLSGGQKRKLSVGIALIGNSKVVVLDEPTSGMDPYSRRSTWNIIQRNKKGRVILLTTHFMDEADILGDRIAIMAEGKLQCVGSSLFLKGAYGVGYTLTVVKDQSAASAERQLARKVAEFEDSNVDSQTSSMAMTTVVHQRELRDAQTHHITDLVQRFVPVAEPLSIVGAEQSYRLPFSASGQLAELFEEFERTRAALKIAEYGISVTTLEEVFMRVGRSMHSNNAALTEGDTAEAAAAAYAAPRPGTEAAIAKPVDEAGVISPSRSPAELKALGENKGPVEAEPEWVEDSSWSAFRWHCRALFIKRAIIGGRDSRMVLCQLILPVLLVVLGLGLLMIRPDLNQPDYILSSAQFNPDLDVAYRNYVPFLIPESEGSVGTVAPQMQARFNGDEENGVAGLAVPIGSQGPAHTNLDTAGVFYGCSQGATPLYNMSSFLLDPGSIDTGIDEHGSTRYGAVTVDGSTTKENLVYNVMVNASGLHGVGVYVNEVHQAFLQVKSGIPTATITTRNFPLPRTFKQDNEEATANAFVTALFCMIAFCFIPASFATFVVKEREVKAKHQQVISGVSIYAYWASTFAWDCISYLPTAALIIAAVYGFDVASYTTDDAGTAVALLFILAGPAVASFTYITSYMFVSHSTAQIMVMFINFITGLGLMVVSFVFTLVHSTRPLNVKLRYFFRLFPAFCLGDGLVTLSMCSKDPSYPGGISCPLINGDIGFDYSGKQGPLAWDITGANIVFLAQEAVIYFLVTLLIEYLLTFPTLLAWLYSAGLTDTYQGGGFEDEDIDVSAERERVRAGRANDDVVRISELRKMYQPASARFSSCGRGSGGAGGLKVAVQSLSFGIPRGECFGFLGINGAGKTTTLSILSGEFPPTSGTAYIDGFCISEDQTKIRRRIGYCPQFDALLELLTVREHLELFGRIKGMRGRNLLRVVEGKLDQLDLRNFEHKTAGSLSGGNKRKLSVAMATIGEPPIVFLDEPSTGMDPVARRFMWQVSARMSTHDGRCSVILTTHSMEEAEALCTRIGVMVNGRLQCLGSAQHLKLRFGDGFEVNVKTALPSHDDLITSVSSLVSRGLLQISLGSDMSQLTSAHLEATRISKAQVLTLLGSLNLLSLEAGYTSIEAQELLALIDAEDGLVSLKTVLEWAWSEKAARLLELFMSKLSRGDAITWTRTTPSAQGSNLLRDRAGSKELTDSKGSYSSSSTVPGSVGFFKLLERSTAHSFRYRLQVNMTLLAAKTSSSSSSGGASGATLTSTSALAYIFRNFEANKHIIRVAEYSVGQTTLEQIFNQFAASQDNPEVAAIQNSESGGGRNSLTTANPVTFNRQRRTSSADYVEVHEELQSFL